MIRIERVKKTFGKRTVVQDVSFTVKAGECVALCGGNGAGKSTIVKMLTGMYRPTSGTISLNGVVADGQSLHYREQFSFMPDDLSFHPLVTGREALTYAAALQNVPLDRVSQMLEVVGLQHHADEKAKTYSKGMQQRLSLAQSLLPETPILLLDEPTNGLDPYWIHRLQQIIKEKQKVGVTVFLTTHALPFAEQLADRLLFLQQSKLIVNESVSQLLTEHGSLEQALFHAYSLYEEVANRL